MYITMTYAIVDAARSQLVFARAGHELPLLAQTGPHGFRHQFVGSEGMPLGLVDPEVFDAVITDREETFGAGALLLLFTDGLTEAPNDDGREFGSARLADAVRSAHEQPAAAINTAIMRAVSTFSRGEPRDDFTLLTLKRRI
jgi:phosphoserine phosphatase RsbU/P